MKIVIAGTGALGAIVGTSFLTSEKDIVFLDNWQENIDAIKKNGICVSIQGEEKTFDVVIKKPEEHNEKADVIFLFTKSNQLENMLRQIQHIICDKTKLICMLNGLGHRFTLEKFVKKENIVMGVSTLTASMNGVGKFTLSSYGNTEIDYLYGNGEDIDYFINLLKMGGFPVTKSCDILYSIWKKACINGTANALCTILDCNLLGLSKIENLDELLENIISEFLEIAKIEGSHLDVEEMKELVKSFTRKDNVASSHFPSMYQDLRIRGRKTEIDYLNGYISKRGKEYGIETKYCDLISTLVRAIENITIK